MTHSIKSVRAGYRAPTAMRLGATLVSAGVLLSACGGGGSTAAADKSKGDIVIGLALAMSGPLAPFDVEPSVAAKMRADEINAQGGIDGRKLKLILKDTRSDKTQAGTVATELVAQGAVALITTCDFDYSAPADLVAQAAKIPAISVCGSDPKLADKKTLGDYVFSSAPGSDVEAMTMVQWAAKKGWKSAYILQDESIEYTKALGKYFAAGWKGTGGQVVGTSSFPGGDNVDVSSQASKIKQLPTKPDFIYVATWNPGGATAIRQLRDAGIKTPILGPFALDGQLLLDIAGQVSDVFYSPLACLTPCTGQQSPELDAFVASYTKASGKKPSSSYAISGVNVINELAAAAKKAGSTDGTKLRDALETIGTIDTPAGKLDYFSSTCHKGIRLPLVIVAVQNGKETFVERFQATSIPNIGDGNTCAGS